MLIGTFSMCVCKVQISLRST